jgi:hypothetical protein
VGKSWAIVSLPPLDLRKLGAIRVERVNELPVVLEQCRHSHARLL